MLINEVERVTGIEKKNIRFYEKEGLLNPERDSSNRYRVYTDEDLRKLNEIKLLRKLGISIADIKKLQNDNLSLTECMKKYTDIYSVQVKELERVIVLCSEIQESKSSLSSVDVDRYIEKIDEEERNGVKFMNIINDFLMINNPKLFFVPDEPIMNHLDFIKELEQFADKKGMTISIIGIDGMMPRILLDGKRYICRLEITRVFNIPFLHLAFGNAYGFRSVYMYEDYTSVDESDSEG